MLGVSEGRRASSKIFLSRSKSDGSAFKSEGDVDKGAYNGPEQANLALEQLKVIEEYSKPLSDQRHAILTLPKVQEQAEHALGQLQEVMKGEVSSLVEESRKLIPPLNKFDTSRFSATPYRTGPRLRSATASAVRTPPLLLSAQSADTAGEPEKERVLREVSDESVAELDNPGGVESGGASGDGIGGAARSVYKFLRPHTIRGTVLASVTGVGRALAEGSAFDPRLLPNAVLGMLALLLGNAFIVGINQIYDVEIDKVNKPFLPVAAGELRKRAAWAIVLSCGVLGPLLVKKLFSPFIFGLYMFGTTIGTLYSVPPFRLKRFPLLAGLTIATVRGFLLNFGVYYATCEALGRALVWNPAVAFLARFMTVFAATIAVTKDLPDIEGDEKYGIETFSTRLGVAPIAKGATAVLLLNYLHAIATALLAAPGVFNKAFMAIGHALASLYLMLSFTKLSPDSQDSVKTFYKKIWDLFYLEYAMYPFI